MTVWILAGCAALSKHIIELHARSIPSPHTMLTPRSCTAARPRARGTRCRRSARQQRGAPRPRAAAPPRTPPTDARAPAPSSAPWTAPRPCSRRRAGSAAAHTSWCGSGPAASMAAPVRSDALQQEICTNFHAAKYKHDEKSRRRQVRAQSPRQNAQW